MVANISQKHDIYQNTGEQYEEAGKNYQAGICFVKAEDDKRALEHFQKVKEDDPNYEKSITQMANIFLRARKPQLVIEKIGKLLKDTPINKPNLDWYYLLGQAYLNSGKFKEALVIFQEVLFENSSFKDVSQKIKETEALAKKFKEMELVKNDSSKRYRIIQKAGEGGMGVVYRAEDSRLKRVVALKILNKSLIKDKRTLEYFYTEARSTASLSHPNIITVYEVGQLEDDYFISMEFIEGENLMEFLRKKKVLAIPQVLFIAIKLLKALDYSHKKGIVHRDIKPHNIMLTPQRDIKVMDFGIAVIRGEQKKGETGVITGTPYYMSPEQIQGIRVDHRTDLYSTGATLFHLLTGRVPFKGENIFYQHLYEVPPSASLFRKGVPRILEQIIGKCMKKARENRYQSAREILNDIKKIKLEISRSKQFFLQGYTQPGNLSTDTEEKINVFTPTLSEPKNSAYANSEVEDKTSPNKGHGDTTKGRGRTTIRWGSAGTSPQKKKAIEEIPTLFKNDKPDNREKETM